MLVTSTLRAGCLKNRNSSQRGSRACTFVNSSSSSIFALYRLRGKVLCKQKQQRSKRYCLNLPSAIDVFEITRFTLLAVKSNQI